MWFRYYCHSAIYDEAIIPYYIAHCWGHVPIPVKLAWIFPGAPLKINGAPGNIQTNLIGIYNIISTLNDHSGMRATFRLRRLSVNHTDAWSQHAVIHLSHTYSYISRDIIVLVLVVCYSCSNSMVVIGLILPKQTHYPVIKFSISHDIFSSKNSEKTPHSCL